MKLSPDNPVENTFGAGITDEAVTRAIKSSGYPLQLIVVHALRDKFSLQEEWSYVDSETHSVRTIDIVASKELFKWQEPQPRIRPTLNLVIECKQSELPYVFFLTEGYPWIPDFPVIAGLGSSEIVITSDDDPSSWSYSPIQVLELEKHTFLSQAAPCCITLSKCVRKGSNLELSGSDPYHSLVFPIIKAVNHFHTVNQPPPTASYFDCEVVVGLAVLDAPMVGVRVTESGTNTTLVPWVRIIRHQPCEGEHKYDRSHTFGIDVVHRAYLQEYLENHLLPFADEFATAVLKHQHVLADSRGFISGMGKNDWTDIESRLQPASMTSRIKRIRTVIARIIEMFHRSK